jgi:hypothetical protein
MNLNFSQIHYETVSVLGFGGEDFGVLEMKIMLPVEATLFHAQLV